MSKNKSKRGAEVDPLVVGLQGLRFSNAAGKHQDRRNKRARTRSAAKSRSMRDQER